MFLTIFRSGAERLNNFRRKIRRFQPVDAAALDTCGFVKKIG
jgi:hypothetical protein